MNDFLKEELEALVININKLKTILYDIFDMDIFNLLATLKRAKRIIINTDTDTDIKEQTACNLHEIYALYLYPILMRRN